MKYLKNALSLYLNLAKIASGWWFIDPILSLLRSIKNFMTSSAFLSINSRLLYHSMIFFCSLIGLEFLISELGGSFETSELFAWVLLLLMVESGV